MEFVGVVLTHRRLHVIDGSRAEDTLVGLGMLMCQVNLGIILAARCAKAIHGGGLTARNNLRAIQQRPSMNKERKD